MRDALATADIMYDEWDPYLRDVIVENNVLIDHLEFKKCLAKKWDFDDLFDSESLNSEEINHLYKQSLMSKPLKKKSWSRSRSAK